MALRRYRYTSDDLLDWQVTVDESTQGLSGGNLPDANPVDLPYPILWKPRRMLAQGTTIYGERLRTVVICNSDNSAWIAGPGSELILNGTYFYVTSCDGEDRAPAIKNEG